MRPTMNEINQPRAIPITPPIRLSDEDSVRNWIKMSRLRAPSALRKPISRVRSVTETSMMFMMPMPPTSSEMPAIPPRKMVSTLVMVCAVLRKSFCEKTVKSSTPMAVRWRWRKIWDTSSEACSAAAAAAICRQSRPGRWSARW